MGREWKPGDVAMVTLPGGSDERQMTRYDTGNERGWFWGEGFNSEGRAHYADDISARGATVRPLVVIDPEDPEQANRLPMMFGTLHRSDGTAISFGDWQQALREFANPTAPKPDEPTGLGAVVEDADGNEWVRHERVALGDMHWRPVGGSTVAKWRAIDAVKVLSEGVRP